MLKILWVFCIYNEIEILPYKIDFAKRNGIGLYVFDNMSTDGSWEWLRENKTPSERFDSNGMFDLSININLLTRKIHEIKPDWVIMAGADIFYVDLKRSLREVIEFAHTKKFNCIHDCSRSFQFKFTGGEKPGADPRLTYMYYVPQKLEAMCIAKYSPGLKFKSADYLEVPEQNPYRSEELIMLHYSMRHDSRKRKTEEYERRKKAWEAGRTPKCYGVHLERIVKSKSFISNKAELEDARGSVFWKRIKESAVL